MNTANPYAPPQATVKDVADSAATPAGRGTRLVAVILDGLIFAAMVYIPLVIGIGINGRPVVVNGHFNPMVISGIGSWLPTIGFIAWCWLTILFVSRNGQSIGKKMLGIKVVRSDGSRASLGRIFLLRNVVNTVLAMVPFYGLVDILLIFGDAQQCVHDKIADTIVIKA
ncbi:MAG TPA: RDD family protein [Steroidobacteraceae bacterium]|nr:RDD family protein [Steroidobacteraceae bacterium]